MRLRKAQAEAEEIGSGAGLEDGVGGCGAGAGEGAGCRGKDGEGDDAGLLELEGFDAAEGGLGEVGLEPSEDFFDGEGESFGDGGAGLAVEECGEELGVEGGGHGGIVRCLCGKRKCIVRILNEFSCAVSGALTAATGPALAVEAQFGNAANRERN